MTIISKLKEAAKAATPESTNKEHQFFVTIMNDSMTGSEREMVSKYIDLANPENILLLIEKLRVATEALKEIASLDWEGPDTWNIAREALSELEKE